MERFVLNQSQIDLRIMKSKKQNREKGEQEEDEMNSELHELFLDELADLLNAETQLTKALPKMVKAAQSEELSDAINSHLNETEGHVERLKQVFDLLAEKPKSKTCQAMKGLLEEGSELLQELKGKCTIDAGIIAAGQKVEHYEIASYGTVRAWAQQMGYDEAVDLLGETLDEEKAADEKLTEIAEKSVNAKT